MKKIRIAVVVLSFVATAASAADAGGYLYGAYGQASSERKGESDAAIVAAGITAYTSSADEKDTAYKLQLGYRVNPYVAIEGGYVNLGKFTYAAAATAPVVATRNGSVEIDGLNLDLKLGLPFAERFAAYATVGAYAYWLDFACSGTGIACTNPKRGDNGTALHYGVGLEWSPGGPWLVRAEVEVFRDVGERFNTTGTTGTTRADVKLGSVGVGYRF